MTRRKRKTELTPQQKARVLRAAENVMGGKCRRVELHKRGETLEVREVVRELTHRA